MTDEEPSSTPSDLPDLEMIEADEEVPERQSLKVVRKDQATTTLCDRPGPTNGSGHIGTATLLIDKSPTSSPSSFAILTDIPPKDHFGAIKQPQTNPVMLKRLNREHRLLATSLPTNQIYVRTYESRLDLLRCLIIGPEDTPYEHAPFLFDIYLENFPHEPPKVHFHSWTHGLGRVNPNLYEMGHICLSLLGTWSGSQGESWTHNSTLLQLLVSLQGLVFVKDPYYNEAGFEVLREQKTNLSEALQYSEKAFVICRNFIRYALRSPVAGLEEVLAWQYAPMRPGERQATTTDHLHQAISRGERLVVASEVNGPGADHPMLDGRGDSSDPEKVFLRPLSRGALSMLRRTLKELEEIRTELQAALERKINTAGEPRGDPMVLC